MTEKQIWDRLKREGLTDEGVAAIMGNLQCESALRPNNVQDGMGHSDEQYTNAVDTGIISEEQFATDQRGYGYAQWTYPDRKRNLWEFIKSAGKSIGDGEMQIEFLIAEFPIEAPDTWKMLHTSTDMQKCAEWVCRYYERPAVNNIDERYKSGKVFYDKFHNTPIETPTASTNTPTETPTDTVTISREEYNFLTRCASVWMDVKDMLEVLNERV